MIKKSYHDLSVGDAVKAYGAVLKVVEVIQEETRRVIRWEEEPNEDGTVKTYKGVWSSGLAYDCDELYEVVER